MRSYEIPPDGSAKGSYTEAATGTEAGYSLEEQVRRTSESVERLSEIFANAVRLWQEGGGDGRP